MSINVEKCRVLSNFVEVADGGGPFGNIGKNSGNIGIVFADLSKCLWQRHVGAYERLLATGLEILAALKDKKRGHNYWAI